MIYEVMVDWDATDWSDDPDFSEAYDDISDDVNTVVVQRGKEREAGNAPAATLEIRIKTGNCAKYSPFVSTGDLAGKIRPWVPVRVRGYHDAAYYPLFAGFISAITLRPHSNVQSVVFYCTDGMDLLARQMITQDPTDTEECSDGDAIGKILDAAGWSASKRDIDDDGGDDLLGYPACTEY